MSILSTSTASWIVDVSHCLGLVDLEPCRLYPATTVPLPPSAPPPTQYHLQRRGAASTPKFNSTPCLAKTFFSSEGSLVRGDPAPTRGEQVNYAPPLIFTSGGTPKRESPPSPPRARWHARSLSSLSTSRLDCSVQYSDGGAGSPRAPPSSEGGKEEQQQLFSSARSALVRRVVCGATRTAAPPLPGSGHPLRNRVQPRGGLSHRPPRRELLKGASTLAPNGESCLFRIPKGPCPAKPLTKSSSESLLRTSFPDGGVACSSSQSSVGPPPFSNSSSSKGDSRKSSSEGSLCLKEPDGRKRGARNASASILNVWIQWKFGSDFHGNDDDDEDEGDDDDDAQVCTRNSTDAASDVTKEGLRRAQSDMSKSGSPQRPPLLRGSGGEPPSQQRQSLGRQYSSPQPIKVRPLHRLPNYSAECAQRNSRVRLKRSKGSSHLLVMRRSVSQPLDLDKSFEAQTSLLKGREDEDARLRRTRRPSVGNLLRDDNSSSSSDEEEGGGGGGREEGRGRGQGRGILDGENDDDDDDDEFGRRQHQQGFKRGLDEEEDSSFVFAAEALWDHVSLDSDELVFRAGDLVTVVDSSDKDWWWGRTTQRSGWFPASFVRVLVNQEEHQGKEGAAGAPAKHGGDWTSRKLSLSSLSQDQVRANVINEIISTERDYVKHLKDVVEGYLRQVRKRPDMFPEDTIATVFGNMEALLRFHEHFLRQLERRIDYEDPHQSCIGQCFVLNKPRFEIYSEYCNNHPSAVSALQELYHDQRYVHFFEACRLLQQMIDISIDGFLLTPVQKICKYPLQLQELLKYTKPSHADYASVHGATQAMKEVALLVNERRRRMECLEKIATWQKGVEGWEGADLLDDSSQLICQGEVTKGVGGSWPKEVALFLFDHQMVYCKRDLLKRTTYVYRGRINTDLCEVIDVPDDPLRSGALHHVWKIHCLHKCKTYVFTCKTGAEKTKWLQAFKRERALVAMDEASGFVASERQKHVARMAAANRRTKPKKPRMKTQSRKQVMTYAQAQLVVSKEKGGADPRWKSLPQRGGEHPAPPEGKKKGHWFSFGGHKKSRNAKPNGFPNS